MVLSFKPQEPDRPTGDFIGPEGKQVCKYRSGPGFLGIDPDPVDTETGPVKVRNRTTAWTQSLFPFLKAAVSGALLEDQAPAIKVQKTGFFLQTERKPKPTVHNTSSPEVSKSKLSQSNRVEPKSHPREHFRILSRNPGGPLLVSGGRCPHQAPPRRG